MTIESLVDGMSSEMSKLWPGSRVVYLGFVGVAGGHLINTYSATTYESKEVNSVLGIQTIVSPSTLGKLKGDDAPKIMARLITDAFKLKLANQEPSN